MKSKFELRKINVLIEGETLKLIIEILNKNNLFLENMN